LADVAFPVGPPANQEIGRDEVGAILAPPEIEFSRFQTAQRAKAVSVGFAEYALSLEE
jgi:hypothetical protein